MTKEERKLMQKIYSLLQILKEDTDKYYIVEEIEAVSEKLQKALEDEQKPRSTAGGANTYIQRQ